MIDLGGQQKGQQKDFNVLVLLEENEALTEHLFKKTYHHPSHSGSYREWGDPTNSIRPFLTLISSKLPVIVVQQYSVLRDQEDCSSLPFGVRNGRMTCLGQ